LTKVHTRSDTDLEQQHHVPLLCLEQGPQDEVLLEPVKAGRQLLQQRISTHCIPPAVYGASQLATLLHSGSAASSGTASISQVDDIAAAAGNRNVITASHGAASGSHVAVAVNHK
jgi:hypothetical protein